MSTAVICGTPTPATIRVVQIEPGPTPTLTASAPWSISASAASPVTMLPPMTWSCGKFFFTHFTRSSTPCEWPVRGVDHHDVDARGSKCLDAGFGITTNARRRRRPAGVRCCRRRHWDCRTSSGCP
jgi:hypothetical protein